MPTFNKQRAAMVLLDSTLTNDRAAAEKWGVSERALRQWRSRLDSDPDFAALFYVGKMRQDEAWATQIPDALAAGIKFLARASEQLDPSDPNAIHAIAGAIKILAEISMTRELIAARFEELN